MNNEFKDNVVVITGGGAGIGKATAELFLGFGAKVVVFDLNVENAPAGADAYVANVTDDEAVATAIGKVAKKYGKIDTLVNNAGVSFYGTVETGSLADWERIIDINVLGLVRVTRAALPHLRRSAHGAIINIASCLAQTGMANRALYSATKGAVEALSRAMAADLVKEGIRVNCVNPGTVDTEFVQGLAAIAGRDTKEFAARQATGHMVSPEEIAHAIAYLARPGARSTVGSVLTVESGFGSLRF
ncbi:SDR family NAD(P)-dependent oxidoreductase [Noviherbaspirillum sedimenti]|uniref:SDR family oxidoreductase n=1 Tax=Noviherbaspirillum sedimenti TaxID=2320865 RepID=A0A3A3G2U9_9BURK|nr:SDR family oxidoreductase [Noviherbaspirillum sedimenti]RJG02818.1 SDR family oxidoreductase [Noviherbaspirillum sedimenti]